MIMPFCKIMTGMMREYVCMCHFRTVMSKNHLFKMLFYLSNNGRSDILALLKSFLAIQHVYYGLDVHYNVCFD